MKDSDARQTTKPTSVDNYLSALPKDKRAALEKTQNAF